MFAHYYLALLVGLSHLPDGKEIGEKSGDYIYIYTFVVNLLLLILFAENITYDIYLVKMIIA